MEVMRTEFFRELADIDNPYFSERAKIVETVARCKCCVIMLDIDCNDLLLEMFNTFFSVVRECHGPSLINDLLSIMTSILNEEASQPLLDVILGSLVKEGQELEKSLKATCEEFIMAVTKLAVDPMLSFATKVTAVKVALFSGSQNQKVDSIMSKSLKDQAFASPDKVHGDYLEDIGTKLERPIDEPMTEGETEVVGA
ncbi:hypothetical protein K2173_021401 [Erythroxylum novogranatense]|uniref:Uncharacterized protein n=1 Tax=Erythroxylum novogranatense TaxID=1862640 RepID=A0AAV8TXJ8_9ROSI|nr:hypothetical protein K2173_021401 [Erythroxylum novogranatense]